LTKDFDFNRVSGIMSSIQRLLANLFIWISSVSIVLYSIAFVLPNSTLHTQKLVQSNFYENVVSSLKPTTNGDAFFVNQGLSTILVNSLIGETITPTWLKGVVETNILTTSRWLVGETENWEFYLPVRDVEAALSKNLDTKTSEFIKENQSKITPCSLNQAESIRTNGFDLSKDFCLPIEVKEGTKSLSDFLGANQISTSTGLLNRVIKGLNLNSSGEIQAVNDFSQNANGNQKQLINTLNAIRNGFVSLRNSVFFVGLLITTLLGINLFLAHLARRKYIFLLYRSILLISLNIALLSGSFVVIIGGSGFLSSMVKSLLFPGFLAKTTDAIIQKALFDFSVSLVSPGLFIGLFLLMAGSVLWLVSRFSLSELINPDTYQSLKLKETVIPRLQNQYSKAKSLTSSTQATVKNTFTKRPQEIQPQVLTLQPSEDIKLSTLKTKRLEVAQITMLEKLRERSVKKSLPVKLESVKKAVPSPLIQNGRPEVKQTQIISGKPTESQKPVIEATSVKSKRIHF
jgi:hypothetical protein